MDHKPQEFRNRPPLRQALKEMLLDRLFLLAAGATIVLTAAFHAMGSILGFGLMVVVIGKIDQKRRR